MDHECPPIESVIADIEKYDLSVMLINEDEDGPRFAYSVGLYHSFKHPEIIVFGLENEVAHWIISSVNDIADLAPGWRAWRERVGEKWRREARIPEEQS